MNTPPSWSLHYAVGIPQPLRVTKHACTRFRGHLLASAKATLVGFPLIVRIGFAGPGWEILRAMVEARLAAGRGWQA
jgi:hypothetical protein